MNGYDDAQWNARLAAAQNVVEATRADLVSFALSEDLGETEASSNWRDRVYGRLEVMDPHDLALIVVTLLADDASRVARRQYQELFTYRASGVEGGS